MKRPDPQAAEAIRSRMAAHRPPSTLADFGATMGLFADRAGLTQKTAAQKIGHSIGSMNSYLNGDQLPPVPVLEAFLKAAGADGEETRWMREAQAALDPIIARARHAADFIHETIRKNAVPASPADFGSLLSRFVLRAGLIRAEVGGKMGTHTTRIARYCEGAPLPAASELDAFMRATGASAEEGAWMQAALASLVRRAGGRSHTAALTALPPSPSMER